MKHAKYIDIPATRKKVVGKITCDMCGNEIKNEMFSAEEVCVKHKTGTIYPEGGSGEEVCVDMCGKCFDEKLIPWIESHGVKTTKTEWDY